MALEAINASTTPWNYNLDLRLDKSFSFGDYGLTVFARVRNLLDARNVLNVYQATGSADDDGFISDAVYSDAFVSFGEMIQMEMVSLTMRKCTEQSILIMMNHTGYILMNILLAHLDKHSSV